MNKNLERRVTKLVADLHKNRLVGEFWELLLDAFVIPPADPEILSVVEDDCDGDQTKTLVVQVAADGDMHISTSMHYDSSRRFRLPIGGGGQYPYIYAALRILHFAMKLELKRRESKEVIEK